ncbi:MAG: hypothetical protein M4579_002669 [Chaenotheca gracillima]|nr:MAG: hypothetical protein M4579_002669 [Chaenotheca gracillima]
MEGDDEEVSRRLERLQFDDVNVPATEELLGRCKALIEELDEYRAFLAERKKQHTVELRQLRNSLISELKSLEKLSNQPRSAERVRHTLRSSNLPYYSAVWDTAKSLDGIVAFFKRFYRAEDNLAQGEGRDRTGKAEQSNGKPTVQGKPKAGGSALVDIVADDGLRWIKVSTVTEKKIVFEMAKRGWEGESSSGEEEEEEYRNGRDDPEDELPLLRLAEDLSQTARLERIRYRHPQVVLVLPKIQRGSINQIDELIRQIESLGVYVQCGSEISPAQPIAFVKERMLADQNTHFSSILNIDCTILLALVSDLSHDIIAVQPWFHRAIKRQIERESEEQLLSTSVWPAMGAKELVCTSEAARRMREIVDTIGTENERRRTALLMGDDPGKGQQDRIRDFGQYSVHQVPREWKLPIKILQEEDMDLRGLPAAAGLVADNLSGINRSVFMYGWTSGRTTISSNRTVTKTIEKLVEENRASEGEVGPDIWLCPTARSLVGKEKGRRDV